MAHIIRVSKLDLATLLSQQNPQIDLRIDAYETSTRNFLNAVNNYTQRAVTEITERKNSFVTKKNKILDKTKQIENETNNCKVKELELMRGASHNYEELRVCWRVFKQFWRGNKRREKRQNYLLPHSAGN